MAETRKSKATPKPAPKRQTAAKTAKPKAAKTAKPKSAAKVPAGPKKKTAAAKPRRAEARPAGKASPGFDVAKLMDHPLVADLLTVGAMAAVAAIADHNVKARTGEASPGSSKAVKAAGKAVAAAVGKRLMTEVDQLRKTPKT